MTMKINITLAFFLLAFIWIACSENQPKDGKQSNAKNDISLEAGKKVFKTYCILCHGADGKLGLNGAKDITVSQLTLEERIILITEGKNTMTPFEGSLTKDEIKAAANYSMRLK